MHMQLQQMDQALTHISQINQLNQKQVLSQKGRQTLVSKTKLKDDVSNEENKKSIVTDRN
jgi:hypothetical protein